MEINPTQQEVAEKFKSVPMEVQDVYISEETASTIRTIGEDHGLEISKIGELADEIGLLLLDFTPKTEFVSNLHERLQIPEEEINNIVNNVNKNILAKIHETPIRTAAHELRGTHKIKSDKMDDDVLISEVESPETERSSNKEAALREALRANNKTVNIKNVITNLK